MLHKLIIKPEADLELMEVIEWHEKQELGLGFKLYKEFAITFKEIQQYPDPFQTKYRNIRIKYTSKFSYGIRLAMNSAGQKIRGFSCRHKP